MLFDLRGRGRRRVVQVIYLSLAILLGGGLVLFGIGGDVQGGLVDAITGNSSGSNNDAIEDDAKDARKAVEKNPRDARAWAVLMEREYRLAGNTDGFSAEKAAQGVPAFEDKARERLLAAERAWDRHLELAGDKPNENAAAIARQLFGPTGLNKPDKSVRAQEVLIETNPDAGFGDYAQLAVLAYQAGQTRKGDLAARRARELAPKDQKDAVKQSIDAAKAQAGAAAAQGATGGAPAPTPAPSGE
jgi:hypothetical protein